MSYRILKLRSGESIIAKIIESKNNQVSIENPMIMNVMTVPDPFLKIKREVLTLSNWLEYSKTKEVTIPEDWIALCLTPDAQTTKLYVAEVNQPDLTKEDLMKEQMMRDDIMKQTEKNLKALEDELDNLADMDLPDAPNFPGPPPSSVFMSFSMNHDMFKKLIEDGLLDQEMDDEFEDGEFEEPEKLDREEKHRSGSEDDFGNDWIDWSPDLRDYL